VQPTYLDNAATTPLDPRVLEAMTPFLGGPAGNPSARHPLGARAREAIDEARRKLARALAVEPRRVVFTSGGTEANNLAVLGIARARRARGRHVLIGATEHPSVAKAARALELEGFELELLPLGPDGGLDLAGGAARLRRDTVLVAQMLANNETGCVYPIPDLARAVRARSPEAALFVDAVQAFGKLDCSPLELGADCVSTSSHKIHGPMGVGALVFAREMELAPLTHGGGQEQGLRAGTENVAGIVGFGRAAELAEEGRAEVHARLAELRAELVAALAPLPRLRVLEPGRGAAPPLPAIAALHVPGVPAEVLLHHLERRGVYVSAGSACNAGHRTASAGLLALGLGPEEAARVLRFSFARTTTRAEVLRGARVLLEVAQELNAVRA
jgi:cysteine desulfurase